MRGEQQLPIHNSADQKDMPEVTNGLEFKPTSERAENNKRTSRTLEKWVNRLVLAGVISLSGIGTARAESSEPIESDTQIEAADSIKTSQDCANEEYIETMISPVALEHVKNDWAAQDFLRDTEAVEKLNPEVVFQGEESYGLTKEQVKQIFIDGYPKNWIGSEVDSIIFTDQARTVLGGTAGTHVDGMTTIKTLRPVIDPNDLVFVDEVIAHETGHGNAWNADNTLSVSERLELYTKVAKRFLEGSNLFYSAYVEGIKDNDPQYELRHKITEYWAEICKAYFTEPEQMKKSHPEDYKLVNEWVLANDPTFDPVQAVQKRMSLIGQFSYEKIASQLTNEARQEFDALKKYYIEKSKEHIISGRECENDIMHLVVKYDLNGDLLPSLISYLRAALKGRVSQQSSAVNSENK